jgi:hypothetical protein
MTLYGERYFYPQRFGELCGVSFLLGEWQKHYKLHDFIVDLSDDKGQRRFELSRDQIEELMQAIRDGTLIYSREYMSLNKYTPAHDLEIFGAALRWLDGEGNSPDRAVVYAFD